MSTNPAMMLLAVMRNTPDAIQTFLDEGGDPSANRSSLLRNAVLRDRTQIVDILLPKCPIEDVNMIAEETAITCASSITMQLARYCTPQTRADILVRANSVNAKELVDGLFPLVPSQDIPASAILPNSYLHQLVSSQNQHRVLSQTTSPQLSDTSSSPKHKI